MIDFSEDECEETSDQSQSKWSFSIIHIMVIGFTLLAFIPLALLMFISYPKIQKAFDASVENELVETSLVSKHAIEKWFNELEESVIHESSTQTSLSLLNELSTEYKNSSYTSISDFVLSNEWHNITDPFNDYYLHYSSMHMDFYDVFMIDVDGNIIYTLANEADLGTNLNTGIYKDTLFANTYRNTVNLKSTQFSDLEYYAPSNNTISGFIVSPIIVDNNVLGAFALQINFENVIDNYSKSRHKSLINYVVNENLMLRNKIINIDKSDILNTKIENKLTTKWINYKSNIILSNFDLDTYEGIRKTPSIGVYHTLNLLNQKWGLIYEINIEDAYASVSQLKLFYIITLLFSVLITIIFSYFLSKKIITPINKLNALSKVIRTGERINTFEFHGFKETNELASNLNKMILQQGVYEHAIEENRKIAVSSLKELEIIQFAMNQHSIITMTNIRGDIIFSNDKFSDISGYSNQELQGSNHSIVNSKHHNRDFWQNMYLTISKGSIWHGEISNKSKNNKIYWVQSTIVPILNTNDDVERYISIQSDITNRKLAEIEIIKSKEIAESAVIAKSEFLASMSHEIRTPMNGILGMLNILQKTKLDTNQIHKVGLATSSAKSLLTIINDILDFSKIEAGKLDIEKIEFNLIELLGEVSESIALSIQNKPLEIILDYSSINQELYIGDPSRIKQILFNLAGNAVKFTSSGSITLIVSTKLISKKGVMFTCKIIDTGIGISEESLPSLFEKFTQADNSTTRKYGGTGLGLAIVKQLVNLMNGTLTATSEVGKGSCFMFNIIIETDNNSGLISRHIKKYTHSNIIIIDSHEKSRINLTEQFNRFNGSTLSFNSLEKANKQNHLDDIDLVVIDEEQITNQQQYDKLLKEYESKSVKLIVMTKVQDKNILNSTYKFSFPKPCIFQDIIYCFETVHNYTGLAKVKDNRTDQTETLKSYTSKIFQHKILLVEDNFVNQQVALSLLEELNCDIEIAEDGQQAIDILIEKQNHFDLILMDCQMPIMDGYKASHQIRLGKAGKSYTQTPIIALTANAMKGDKEKCLAAGMDDYLTKPIEQDQLALKLKAYLNF
ncbi:MAG: response regulator [Saccharospirillaceae bacterium]|nr:ATP-binding protein [Pseudomonadales bacterium]NRB80690.1 response regulator [Saccharospirillaceae bacterium]